MDLDARAVELAVDHALADLLHGLLQRRRRRGEHRLDRPADLQPEAVQALLAFAQRRLGDDPRITAQHRRAVDRRARDAGRHRDRVGHHARQRALADLAGDQPAQERLLVLGRAGEELDDRVAPRRLRSSTGLLGDVLQREIDITNLQRRLGRRRREVLQRRPANTRAPLAQLAAQVGDGGLDLAGLQRAQRFAQQLGLALARAGRADGERGGGEIGEEHRCIVPHSRARSGDASGRVAATAPRSRCERERHRAERRASTARSARRGIGAAG